MSHQQQNGCTSPSDAQPPVIKSSHYEKKENLLPVGCLVSIDFVRMLQRQADVA
jgi:hypothetical protein